MALLSTSKVMAIAWLPDQINILKDQPMSIIGVTRYVTKSEQFDAGLIERQAEKEQPLLILLFHHMASGGKKKKRNKSYCV